MNNSASKKKLSKSQINYDIDLLKDMYTKMLLIRRFEEKAGQLYGMGKIGGFCHLYIGQEAVVVGIPSAQIEGDSIVTSYRDHGHMIACDMDPKGVMAELTGRKDGYSKGKGGSMHMFSREKGFFGGHGIVAAQVPIGTGLAFSHKYNETKNVCITYFGDGAANQGQVYEAYNIASLWKLPVIFVIENNNTLFTFSKVSEMVCHYMIINFLLINLRLHYHQVIQIPLVQKIFKRYWPFKLKNQTIILQPKPPIYLM